MRADPSAIGKFTVNRVYDLVIVGLPEDTNRFAGLLANYTFVRVQTQDRLYIPREGMFFILAVVNFDRAASMQEAGRIFNDSNLQLAHKLIYASQLRNLKQDEVLFAVEVGARHAFQGPSRDDETKAYLKRYSFDSQKVGTVSYYEYEMQRIARDDDRKSLEELAVRMAGLKSENEELLCLLANLYLRIGKYKHAENCLKNVLRVNSQNLWAANALAKNYMRAKRVSEAIEVFEKLSQFNELNGERYLELGDAYLNSGERSEAERVFNKGKQLTNGQDRRFDTGLAKATILGGDRMGALKLLGQGALSYEVISFLNTRAIMAIRTGNVPEGIRLYNSAFEGAPADDLIKAKLRFNMGLCFVRNNDLQRAVDCFEESATFGGDKFRRAKRPLAITKQLMEVEEKKRTETTLPESAGTKEQVVYDDDDFEWEQMN